MTAAPKHLRPHSSCTSSRIDVINCDRFLRSAKFNEYRSSHKMWLSADIDLRPIDRSIPSFYTYIYFTLTIMNSTVTAVESFRFLGTTISQDLKWDNHIKSIVKKAQQRLYILPINFYPSSSNDEIIICGWKYHLCCCFWISRSMNADLNVFNTCFTSGVSVELEQRMFCCRPYQWITAFTSEAWRWPTHWH